jgi:two-component sensor histidine kinase
MREKNLLDMISKLTQLKFHAKTSEEIFNALEDIRQNLQYLQSEVIIDLLIIQINMFYSSLATK